MWRFKKILPAFLSRYIDAIIKPYEQCLSSSKSAELLTGVKSWQNISGLTVLSSSCSNVLHYDVYVKIFKGNKFLSSIENKKTLIFNDLIIFEQLVERGKKTRIALN